MSDKIKQQMQKVARSLGYEITAIASKRLPKDMERDGDFMAIYNACKDFSTSSPERIYAYYSAVEYIVKSGIPGDFAECGVFRGGSSMALALTLLKMQDTSRKLYLYDTYAGMPKPTEKDKDIHRDYKLAFKTWEKGLKDGYNEWRYAPLEEAKKNMFSTGYPQENMIFVKGKVEDTIPGTIPSKIAILMLDTDFYESTYHELKHLFPILSKGGILIFDDYGSWTGEKEAADRYFSEMGIVPFLNRLDLDGRLFVKAT